MAIAIVAGSNLANAVADDGNVTLSWPTLQAGDVAYVMAGHADGTAPTMSTSGYTQVDSHGSGGSRTAKVWRKVMGGTPDTSVTVAGSGNTAVAIGIAGIVFRGVDQTTPEDATPTHANANSTNPDSPSITTLTDGAEVIAFFWSIAFDTAVTTPSGYSNSASTAASDTTSATVGVASKNVATAGAEDPPSWTNVFSGQWLAFSIAVRPAGAGGGASMMLAQP